MATLTVRNLDDETKQGLQHRAVQHGVSMEQEVRTILNAAVRKGRATDTTEESLYEAIRKLVEPHGGFEIELPERGPMREPPTFE